MRNTDTTHASAAIAAQKVARVTEYNKNPKLCANPGCGKPIRYEVRKEAKFCSQSCAAYLRNSVYRKHGRYAKKPCRVCGKKTKTVYCSRECYGVEKSQKTLEDWLSGKTKYDTECLPVFIRKYVIEQANDSCTECSGKFYNKYTGKTVLQVHHKDGNWRNNAPENLTAMCPTCHAMTENYGSRNKGKGRPYRKKYYTRP